MKQPQIAPKILENEVEKVAKTPRVYRKIEEKHAAFAILVNNGVDKVIAAEALGYQGKTAYALQKRIEKKGVRLDVACEKLVRLSHRVIRNCLQGKPWGKIETIKDSTALAAAQVVIDRHQPKNQETSPPPRTFTVVNLDECKPGHPSYKGDLVWPDPVSSVELADGVVDVTPDAGIGPNDKPPEGTR
jgi:hypothetical protein